MKFNPVTILIIIGLISVGAVTVDLGTTVSYARNVIIYVLGGNPGEHQRNTTNVECDASGRCSVIQPAE